MTIDKENTIVTYLTLTFIRITNMIRLTHIIQNKRTLMISLFQKDNYAK